MQVNWLWRVLRSAPPDGGRERAQVGSCPSGVFVCVGIPWHGLDARRSGAYGQDEPITFSVSLSVQGLTEKVHADTFRCSPDALASEA